MYLHGTDNQHQQPRKCKIKRVTITNESGGGLGLSVFPGSLTSGTAPIRVVAGDDVTAQADYDGVEFHDGFTVVPDSGLTFYGIEYDPIES